MFEVYIFIVWLRVLDLRLGFGFEDLTLRVIVGFIICVEGSSNAQAIKPPAPTNPQPQTLNPISLKFMFKGV